MRKSEATTKASAGTAIKSAETKKPAGLGRQLLGLALRLVVIAAVLAVVFGVVFGLKRMRTVAMQPSMREGDLLLYYRLDHNYQLGDVVIFEREGKDYILRIVALAGQTVEVTDDGSLLIDGYPEATETFYLTEKTEDLKYPYQVRDGEVFVMGDYRMGTDDSRRFGAVRVSELKGKVIGRFQVRNL